jgi:uncharacterized membrane-anchored protein YhcB (DUF1043 family)
MNWEMIIAPTAAAVFGGTVTAFMTQMKLRVTVEVLQTHVNTILANCGDCKQEVRNHMVNHSELVMKTIDGTKFENRISALEKARWSGEERRRSI